MWRLRIRRTSNEARETLRRVEELDDCVGTMTEVIGLWTTDKVDARFMKNLKARTEQRRGCASQPWQFRIVPSDDDEH